MPTCAFITLGCKVNQYDTQVIREGLERLGYREVAPAAGADLYVVNTCCVTQASHRKGLRLVRRLGRERPGAAIAVTGCSVETEAEAFRAIPGVCLVAGNAAKPRLAELLTGAQGGHSPAWPSISRFAGHTRAFVKIQDGCDDFCAYCIVPHVRGRVRSRPPDEVVEEVRRLVGHGYLEVVLTGIHLGCYGQDSGGAGGLVPLVERLLGVAGLRRLRLSSLELREVSDGLIAVVAGSEVACPHFHIPLQSGDDAVLEAMNRHYTAADYLRRLDAIRARIEEPAITTDIIVGFPGETEERCRHTVEAARRAGFSRIHVFPYSDREGTAASRLPGKLPRETVAARREEMLGVARELARAYHRRFVGRDIEVLVEGSRDSRTGLLCGYSKRYVRALFDGDDALQKRLVPVRVQQALARGVRAVLPGSTSHPEA